jgi:ABC-type sugar transport system permease subunit
MLKIDRAVYEAASIDGASAWQTFWKITLPSLRQFTVLNIFYTIVFIGTFSENPILIRIRRLMMGNAEFEGFGYSSALAWLYFLLMVLMLGLFLFLTKERKQKREENEIWRR